MNARDKWIASFDSVNTQESYAEIWDAFWDFADKRYTNRPAGDPIDWLVKHRYDEVNLAPPDRFHCEDIVTEYYNTLKDTDLSDGSIKIYIAAIKSFFKHATRNVGALHLQIKFGKKRVRFKYIPTQIDLVKLKKYCNRRTWALAATIKDTGLGPEDLTHITWGKIDKVNTDDPKFWFMSGQREKTDEPFSSFFGPDATDAIVVGFGTGQGRGPDTAVFEGFTSNAIRMAIKRASIAAGLPENFSAYSLRGFYNTQLEIARVPDNWRKRAMGHAVGVVQGAYSGPQIQELLKTYKAAYHYLTVETNGGDKSKGLSAEDVAELLSAFMSKDKAAIAKLEEKYGVESPLSKL